MGWSMRARLLCLSLSPGVCSNSCLLSWWSYLTVSSSASLFSFCLQSFPASRSFPVSQLFTLGGQSFRCSASASILPMNIQGWFSLSWLVWSPCCLRESQEFFQHHSLKASICRCSAFFMVQFSYPYMTTGKTIALTIWTFVGKWCLCFFISLSRFVIAFLPRSKRLLISWLQSLSTVILEPEKIKSATVSVFSPSMY